MTQLERADRDADPEAAPGARVAVEHVSRRFGPIAALDDVSVAVGAGELLAISGRSGSGKSTLLNVIGGLDRPDSGSVLIDGRPLAHGAGAVRARRELIGFVFQQHFLLSELSAALNVEVPLIGAGVPARERRERALALLDEVGLSARAEHRPAMLSGGERQRVAVARALANGPRLLLADEPTAALDTTNSERIIELLVRVRERRGMTVVVVSYDPAVYAHADRTLQLIDGHIVDETR